MSILFVDQHAARDPRRFVSLLVQTAQDWRVESELDRVSGEPTVFTHMDDDVAAHLELRQAPFLILGLPDSPKHPAYQRFANRCIWVHPEHEDAIAAYLEPPTGGSEATPLGERCWAFPRNPVALWEEAIAQRALPSSLTVLTPPLDPPPRWLLQKLNEHGCNARWLPGGLETLGGADATATHFHRDPGALDPVDLAIEAIKGDSREDLLASDKLLTVLTERLNNRQATPQKRPPKTMGSKIINIVCFNPTYLFADLVKRFEAAGCVHSELPLPDAGAYIWMRPQELAAFGDLLAGRDTTDVPQSWQDRLASERETYEGVDFGKVEARSVAIHHGTCYEPIIQFDPYRLAKVLATAGAVAGVCELDLCYGPSRPWANPANFHCVPIGYDHNLFHEGLIREDNRTPSSPLRIGFVGRAYGNNNPSSWARSNYAHPRGYRKGGDHLIHVLLRLKAKGVPFELHLVGNNWDEHVAQMEDLEIPVVYYTRDKNIDYEDYPTVFASFDVLLIAARAEGGPVSAIEAMSVGVPVVGTDVGVIPYLDRVCEHSTSVGYHTKWHTFDDRAAADAIAKLQKKPFGKKERLAVRDSIKEHTTDGWVHSLKQLAEGLL